MNRRVSANMMLLAAVVLVIVCPPQARAQSHADAAGVAFDVPRKTVLSGDPVAIRLTGLDPGAEVTISAERVYGRRPPALHRASARFLADRDGVVDLERAQPVAAAWEGVDPRGLFWSMQSTEDPWPDGQSSTEVHFKADANDDGEPEAEVTVRLLRARDDLVETALGDRFPGAFLLRPPGDEPLPAIIVLGGSEGGDRTARSRGPQLASRGYAVVGLPYYSPAYYGQTAQFPELPAAFHNVPLDQLEAVRDWLRGRTDVVADRIGLYGVSKGAEFVLAGASRIDGFAAVVAYVPSDVIWEAWGRGTAEGEHSCFSWRGEPLPFVPYVGMNAEIAKYQTGERVVLRTPHDKGRVAHAARLAAARIRVEDIDEPVFVVGGDADEVWDSGGMTRNIAARREAAGLETAAITAPDAGHGLSGNGYGPARAADARVQGRAFPAMLAFFERHLRQ
ncbi:MAG: acyl-CoA thioesterase/bile acid-CoA:amino acid N-acyltransferase family protein [Planctomycetota bacterium]